MQQSIDMEHVAMMVVIPTVFITAGWVLRGLGRYLLQRRALLAQSELISKLLDRFGTAPELLRYLESDAGARIFQAPAEGPVSPHARILGAVQAGIVLAALGIAFLALQGLDLMGGEGFAVIGALGLALGLGFLASGAAAFYLSRSWGLMNGRESGAGERSES